MRYRLYLFVLGVVFHASVHSRQEAGTQQDTNPGQAGKPLQEAYEQQIGGTDLTLEMVPIRGGKFTPAVRQEGIPPDEVQVEPFWMSSREITWGLYKLFLERTADTDPQPDLGREVDLGVDAVSGATVPYVDMSLGMGTGKDLPVGNVTRRAAARFCKWLSAKTGYFYRLPTEAEWEYAARAGTESQSFYEGGPDNLDRFAWYEANSGGTYHPVGTKEPNPWGLYDIYGNVAEWTLDDYQAGSYGVQASDFDPASSEYPGTLRGGSYRDQPGELNSTYRMASDPVWKQRDPQFPRSKWWFTDAPFAGFRIVRPAEPPPPAEFSRYWDTE